MILIIVIILGLFLLLNDDAFVLVKVFALSIRVIVLKVIAFLCDPIVMCLLVMFFLNRNRF